MSKRHKYFRRQAHKHKLQRLEGSNRRYYSCVKYYTEEPDMELARRTVSSWRRLSNETYEELLERNNQYHRDGRGKFVYYTRPNVPYSIAEVQDHSSTRKVYLKRQANRKVRHDWKQKRVAYNYGSYKKAYELPWELW